MDSKHTILTVERLYISLYHEAHADHQVTAQAAYKGRGEVLQLGKPGQLCNALREVLEDAKRTDKAMANERTALQQLAELNAKASRFQSALTKSEGELAVAFAKIKRLEDVVVTNESKANTAIATARGLAGTWKARFEGSNVKVHNLRQTLTKMRKGFRIEDEGALRAEMRSLQDQRDLAQKALKTERENPKPVWESVRDRITELEQRLERNLADKARTIAEPGAAMVGYLPRQFASSCAVPTPRFVVGQSYRLGDLPTGSVFGATGSGAYSVTIIDKRLNGTVMGQWNPPHLSEKQYWDANETRVLVSLPAGGS